MLAFCQFGRPQCTNDNIVLDTIMCQCSSVINTIMQLIQSTNVMNDTTPGNDTPALLADACTRATRYLHDIQTRRVFPLERDIAALARLRGPLPMRPEEPRTIPPLPH